MVFFAVGGEYNNFMSAVSFYIAEMIHSYI